MRLIDADELIKKIEVRIADFKKDCNAGAQRMTDIYEYEIRRMLEKEPTAYDVDKVINQLKAESCLINDNAGNRAIEIIEAGGKDE